jgi:predicted ATP-dependent serine protease
MAKWALDRCDPDQDCDDETHIEQFEDILAVIEDKLPNELQDKENYLKVEEGVKEEDEMANLMEEMMSEINEDLE